MNCGARYTVKPFGGAHYADNTARCLDDETPCGICGRGITDRRAKRWVVVIDGGARWGTCADDQNDSGYMGAWPIGDDCHRRFSAQRLAPAVRP